MMCYRGREFCRGDGCAKFGGCNQALTPAVIEGARRWWGGPGAPIAQCAEPKLRKCYVAPTTEQKGQP